MKRSKIDRLFRLWDALMALRERGMHITLDAHNENMEARRALRKILAEEYGVPRGEIAKTHLTVGGCIQLIRTDNDRRTTPKKSS